MTKKQFKENLVRRITNLSNQEIKKNQSEWGIGYDTGHKQACLEILDMIQQYE